MESIGYRLRQLRKVNRYRQDDISSIMNITNQTLSKYETGVIKNIPTEKLLTLAKLYHTTAEYILTGKDAKKTERPSDGERTLNKIGIGKRIKESRIARGYTQKELAERVQINISTICRYETGLIESPRKVVITEIARKLNVSPSWLITGETDTEYDSQKNSEAVYLRKQEYDLIKKYRKLNDKDRDTVEQVINVFIKANKG